MIREIFRAGRHVGVTVGPWDQRFEIRFLDFRFLDFRLPVLDLSPVFPPLEREERERERIVEESCCIPVSRLDSEATEQHDPGAPRSTPEPAPPGQEHQR